MKESVGEGGEGRGRWERGMNARGVREGDEREKAREQERERE